MEKRSVTHSTFVIERTYAAAPERVFAALADPKKKRRWFAEAEGRDIEEFQMDFRVGGNEHSRGRFQAGHRFAGTTIENHTHYQDIVPGKRVVFAYTMTIGDRRISASLATLELLPSGQGTDFVFTDQGAYFEGADGPAIREQGWRKLLELLAEELTREESEPSHAAAKN